MGMHAAAGGSVRHEINVTPLVDVVLVLLIIFMVGMPLMQLGYKVEVPPRGIGDPQPQSPSLIVRLERDGRIFLNRDEVTRAQLPTRLRAVVSTKRPVLFAADGELPYGEVVDFMDFVRDSGARDLGIVFDDLKPAV